MKALERILWMAYGNHSQTKEYRDLAEVIVERLRREGEVSKQELMVEAGLNPSSDSDDQKFKRIMRPLKGEGGGSPLEIQFVVNERSGNRSLYRLSRHTFRNNMNKVKQNVERFLESDGRDEKAELRERVAELEKTEEKLRERLKDQDEEVSGPG